VFGAFRNERAFRYDEFLATEHLPASAASPIGDISSENCSLVVARHNVLRPAQPDGHHPRYFISSSPHTSPRTRHSTQVLCFCPAPRRGPSNPYLTLLPKLSSLSTRATNHTPRDSSISQMAANITSTEHPPLSHSLSLTGHGSFKHTPLDHSKPSIRLVRIHPSISPHDVIRCTIIHATVNTKYNCLSYRWGDPTPSRLILVNEQPFTVRENLFNFLSTINTRYQSNDTTVLGPYWIDALSIDQANTPERNHQVAQMGQIFSKAAHVYVWLGLMPPSVIPLFSIIQKGRTSSYNDWGLVHRNKDVLDECIIQNQYWTRAWITQEIGLARYVTVWVDAYTISFKKLIAGLEYFYLIHTAAKVSTPFSRLARRWIDGSKFDRLVVLLAQFHDKECEDPRDRVFSILALCSDEGRHLEVDYNITLTELAVRVLSLCNESLCICSAALVVQALGLRDLKPSVDSHDVPYLEFDVVADMFVPDTTPRHIYFSHYEKRELGWEPLEDDHWASFFRFYDTCSSFTLSQLQLSWDENVADHSRTVQWSYAKNQGTHNRVLYGHGFKLLQRKGEKNVFTVRVALWLLARIVTDPVELCRNAKASRTREHGSRIGYPLILHGSQNKPHRTRDLPRPDTRFQVPWHLQGPVAERREQFLENLDDLKPEVRRIELMRNNAHERRWKSWRKQYFNELRRKEAESARKRDNQREWEIPITRAKRA
jgi:hypothetical protein